MEPQRFVATVVAGPRSRVYLPVPFDPDAVWGAKPVHHVRGSVGAVDVRGIVEPLDGGHAIRLGPAWRRDRGIEPGDTVEVELAPEGPQRADVADDLAAALDARPEAAAFFDGLAQFYRRAYLTWIDGATRRPQVREQRIADVVGWLAAGIKQRPR